MQKRHPPPRSPAAPHALVLRSHPRAPRRWRRSEARGRGRQQRGRRLDSRAHVHPFLGLQRGRLRCRAPATIQLTRVQVCAALRATGSLEAWRCQVRRAIVDDWRGVRCIDRHAGPRHGDLRQRQCRRGRMWPVPSREEPALKPPRLDSCRDEEESLPAAQQWLRQAPYGLCRAWVRPPSVQHGKHLRLARAVRHVHHQAAIRQLRQHGAGSLQLPRAPREHEGAAGPQRWLFAVQGVGLAERDTGHELQEGGVSRQFRAVGADRQLFQPPGRDVSGGHAELLPGPERQCGRGGARGVASLAVGPDRCSLGTRRLRACGGLAFGGSVWREALAQRTWTPGLECAGWAGDAERHTGRVSTR
mmetsp:Transcript_146009/g.406779  ORF Transcript_146009/g.406779 Transcript_146009/m.406779 type:complete len:360 (-) Transcript_146009:114-1193(-)